MSRSASYNGEGKPSRPSFHRLIKKRTEWLFYLFAAGYFVIGGRLAFIQGIQHGWYADKARKLHQIRIPLVAHRGSIRARDGEPLAVTMQAASVYLNPRRIPANQRERVVRSLVETLQLPEKDIRPKVFSPKAFVWADRGILIPTAEKMKSLKLPGVVVLENETKRVYPNGSFASNLIGFTNEEGHGLEGLEYSLDRELSGVNGSATAIGDASRVPIAGTRKIETPAREGRTLDLSIDFGLQMTAENELDKVAKKYEPIDATCAVMDVRTGEILAMATYPRYNLSDPYATPIAKRRNLPVTDTYEPGSTLKTVTIASALDCGAINLQSSFYCAGRYPIGKHTIRCVVEPPFHDRHGAVRPLEIIEYSCNIGATQVAFRMGQDAMKKYLGKFGFGHKTGIEFPGEAFTRIPGMKKRWADIQTSNISFGQGISVTPIQLLAAYAAIANGGSKVKPTLFKSDRSALGERILKPETAHEMLDLMQGCVLNGTGKTAKIRGYEVAGKTGSAQKSVNKRYSSTEYIASFASIVPADHPRIAILTTVDAPKGVHWGAVVAAPVAREVARQAVIDLGIQNDPNNSMDGSQPKTWKKEDKT